MLTFNLNKNISIHIAACLVTSFLIFAWEIEVRPEWRKQAENEDAKREGRKRKKEKANNYRTKQTERRVEKRLEFEKWQEWVEIRKI